MTIKALIAAIIIACSCGVKNVEVYPTTFIVTEVDTITDEVTLTDFNGEEWVWCGCEDWTEGDIASAIICNNGTKEFYDDIILDMKYSGYVY